MKKLQLFLIFLFASNSIFSQESNAGVLPYTIKDGEMLILLSRECGEYKFWTDFIGKHDSKDQNDKSKTALREFMEETRYVFSEEDVFEKLQQTNFIRLSKYNTFRYIIEVSFVSVDTILSKPYYNVNEGNTEKVNYCWIDYFDLRNAIDISVDSNNVYLPNDCIGQNRKLYNLMYDEIAKRIISKDTVIPTTRIKLDSIFKNRIGS